MRRFLLLVFLMACKVSLFASHIVGGEFELLHIEGYSYRLNMILYFDRLNGAPGAEDPQVEVHFYRKSDNQFIRSLILAQISNVFVEYSNPSCDPDNDILSTSKIIYTSTIALPA